MDRTDYTQPPLQDGHRRRRNFLPETSHSTGSETYQYHKRHPCASPARPDIDQSWGPITLGFPGPTHNSNTQQISTPNLPFPKYYWLGFQYICANIGTPHRHRMTTPSAYFGRRSRIRELNARFVLKTIGFRETGGIVRGISRLVQA